jgi:thioredoxin 1
VTVPGTVVGGIEETPMSTLLKFTDQNFKAEVLESHVPVVVDFSAVWCGPCKQLTPIVEELSKEFAGKVKIGKMDIDEDRETPTRYDVMAVPTLLFLKGGQEVGRITGFVAKPKVKAQIDALLAPAAK